MKYYRLFSAIGAIVFLWNGGITAFAADLMWQNSKAINSAEWYPCTSGLGNSGFPPDSVINPNYSNNYLDRTIGMQDLQAFRSRLLLYASVRMLVGDINTNGKIDLADVILSLQVSAGISTTAPDIKADVNNDQKIGLVEAVYALQTTTIPTPQTSEACGIYSLDSKAGTVHINGLSLRDKNFERIQDIEFVTGYAWRQDWDFFETGKENYDFSGLDLMVQKVSTRNKQLGLLLKTHEPDYVIENAEQTWTVATNHDSSERSVPWDDYTLEQYEKFIYKLSMHEIGGVKFKDNPTLAYLTVSPTGMHLIRDRQRSGNIKVCEIPNYSREKYVNAVMKSLRIAVENFPDKTITVGLWKITDNDNLSEELWEEIRKKIIDEFNGKIGFFMENLAASKDDSGIITGFPSTNYAETLYLSKDSVPICFQALTSWKTPFTGHEKVANALPIDGINYAQETFNTKYFEIYVPDLLDSNYSGRLADWVNNNCE